jgi:hypothetical protein
VTVGHEGGFLYHRDIPDGVAVEVHRIVVSNPPDGQPASLRFRAFARIKPGSFGSATQIPLPAYPPRYPPTLSDPLNVAPGRAEMGSLAWLWYGGYELDGYDDIADAGALRFTMTDLQSDATVELPWSFTYPPNGQERAAHVFPVLFHCEGFEQDDEFDPRNTRLRLHLRAVNRTKANASLILHLGIKDPNKSGFRLWQQARTAGTHPLAVLSPIGRAEPTDVPGESAVKLEPEFLFAKEYVEDLRTKPPAGVESAGAVELEHLWLRARDLISGEEVENPLESLDEL